MKIGLLGHDQQILSVALAAVAAGDQVGPIIDGPEGLPASLPTTDRLAASEWQLLLESNRCDAVLVGIDNWNDERAEQVRTLVQAGRPLLIGHPPCLSMLWAYELDMMLADTTATVVPFLPARQHPLISDLKALLEQALAGSGPFGAIETLRLERRQPDRDREAVLASFSRDADLVRVLVGDPARLLALGSGDDATWPTLAIGLTGPNQLPVRWQVAKGQPAGLTIELVCANGTVRLDAPDAGDWQLHEQSDQPDENGHPQQPAQSTSGSRYAPGEIMLATLRDQLVTPPAPPPPNSLPPATWPDAARAIELAETVPRSLKRGRTIDLHQEEFSELGTFRGTMASLGCGIIMVGLLVLFLATLVGGVARAAGWEFAERLAGIWPYVILGTLLLFLALQLLPLLLPRSTGPSGSEPPSQPEA